MTKTKNTSSISMAILRNEKGQVIKQLYLSRRDEEQGIDIQLDMQGYEIIAL